MCNITVTSANRIRIGISFELYAIVLEGEKEDCSGDIAVSISSNPGVVASRDFIADINGNHWSVTIVLSETNELFETAFPCKSKIYVTPRCTTNEKCDANTTEITLRCEPPETRPEQPVLTCPTVASPLQANVANTCNNDGTRTVSVDITLNPVEGSLVTAELEIYPYQNGELSAFRATVDNDPNASTSNTLGGEIDLVPGDYRAVVDFSQPQPDCEVPALDFTVSACEVDIPEPEPRPNDTVQSVTCRKSVV